MQIEMTERDRKLLVFLSIFVIVVCIGYWGIYPQIKAIRKMNNKIETEEELKNANEMKISELPFLEKDAVDLNEQISSARGNYYPVMTADEIDKYFTNKALDNNLYAYSLNISMPEEYTTLSPYQYSRKAIGLDGEGDEFSGDDSYYDDSYSDDSYSEDSSMDAYSSYASDTSSDEEDSEEGGIVTGIYQVTITMRLGGKPETLKKFVNDLSNSDQKHFISNYSYSIDNEVAIDENGEYVFSSDCVLDITIELFMCEEFADGTNQ